VARRFLASLRREIETKSVTFTGVGGLGRATGGWGPAYGAGAGENRAAGWDLDKVIRDGYERVVWVYKSVEAISGHQSRLPFQVGRDLAGDDKEVLDEHPLYRVMNRRANPAETGRAFRKRLSAQVLLSKKGAFVEVTKSRAGTITRLDLLPPDRVEIMPSLNGDYIDYFQLVDRDGTVRELSPERVRWIREPHPTDPFSGTPPLEAAGMSVELDAQSRLYNVSFIKNDGRPGGIVGVDADSLDPEHLDRIERKLGRGAHRAGEIAIVGTGPGGLKYVDTTTRPRDMAYGEASANAKLEILIAFGVPESVIGSAAGRTFDNAEQEGFNFWTETMMPHLDLIASAFDEDVDDEWEPFLDTATVQVLELPRRQARAEAREEFDKGLRSVDEYRPLADLEPMNNPQSRALWLPPSKAPVPATPEDAVALGMGDPAAAAPGAEAGMEGTAAEAVAEARGLAGGTAADAVAEARGLDPAAMGGSAEQALAQARGESSLGGQPGDAAEALDQARMEGKAAPGYDDIDLDEDDEPAQDGATVAGVPPVTYDGGENRQQQLELAVAAAFEALLARQLGVLNARLQSPKARKGTKFWTAGGEDDTRGGDEPFDVARVVDAERWTQEVADTVQPIVAAAATRAGTDMLTQLAQSGQIVTAPSEPVGQAAAWTAEAAAATSVVVFGAVAHAEAAMSAWLGDVTARLDGAIPLASDVLYLGAELRDMFADRAGNFARGIAVEVATGTVNGAENAIAEALLPMPGSDDVVRQWVSRRDPQVRPAHQRLDDGTKLPVGKAFEVDGVSLRWPGDPLAPASLTRNCRCRLWFAVAPDARYVAPPVS
jgi:HK97 family phage portal protein